jgi:hypothetical protein
MAETILSTSECTWSQTSLQLLDRKTTGLRGFEVKLDIEKEHVYASGSKPVDIQDGNEKPEGSFKMLKYELDLLNDAAQVAGYANIAKVPHTLISAVIQYKKGPGSPIRIITIVGISFTSLGISMEQNAKYTEVTLPWIAMDVIHSVK